MKILILRNESERLSDIEHFLIAQDFKVDVVHRAQDGIRYITEEKPDYTLISTSLLPQKSHWLLGILNQLTTVILFFDRVSARNLAITRDSNGSYILEPPLTPLGLKQVLRRIQREQNKQNELTSSLDKNHLWIMSTLSDLSLKAICTPASMGASVERVQRATRVTCLRLRTNKLSGFLVLAYGKNRQLESDWLHQLQSVLKKRMEIFDDQVLMSTANEIQIEEVKFKEWSKEQSEFILQAIHQDAEVVLAFFKDSEQIEAKPSARKGYVELGTHHLPENGVIDFDVYIYLPQNARFVLHTPRGGTLHSSKKQKLISEGIHSVHIPKRSLDQVHQHHIRKFVEESSQDFR